MPDHPEIPAAAVEAANRAENYRLGRRGALAVLDAALPHLLPGLYLALDGGNCPTIWADGTTSPRATYTIVGDDEPLLARTEANARLFDAIAALVPDRTDDEDGE